MTQLLTASGSQSQGGSAWIWFIPLILLAFMFLLSRRRQRQMQTAQRQVQVGDQVSTTSGLLGELVELDDNIATIEAAPGVRLRFDRRAIVPATVGGTPLAQSEQGESGSTAIDEEQSRGDGVAGAAGPSHPVTYSEAQEEAQEQDHKPGDEPGIDLDKKA